MGNHSSYPNPHLRGILPPYILEAIVKNAPDRIAEVASETLRRDTFFRNSRVNQAVLAGEASPQVERKSASTVDAVTPERLIYDVDHKGRQHLPGKIIRREGQVVCGDDAADEAYEGLGHTFEFYRRIFQRNSIDDEGMALLATVHYNERHNNAFWDGRQMVFGDGDGYYFQRFTLSLDIIGHELAHGVVQHTAGLQYSLQAGALNESICDVMGSLLKQWLSKETVERADWLIGAGLFTNRVQGVALRSMQQPGTAFDDPILEKDPQVGHMNDFVRTEEDNGGVHINSGIPNRAFYLAATAIGGYAWEKAGQIWYTTLCDKRLKNSYGFMRFARLTVDNAGRLFSQKSMEQKAVREAWMDVGVNP